MISLIYVSRAKVAERDRQHVLDDIAAVSTARNSMLDITGLLIVSPGHFAQLLEGPVASIAAVMSSITADPRHIGLRIVRQSTIQRGSYPHWRMARFDSEIFGAARITPVLQAAHAGEDPAAIHRLERLIEAVARSTGKKGVSRRSGPRAIDAPGARAGRSWPASSG